MRAGRIFAVMEALLVVLVAFMLAMALQPLWQAPFEDAGARGRGVASANLAPGTLGLGLNANHKGFRSRAGRLFLVSPSQR
jgi:hypothetical protein